jgi:RNA polymerase sigma-70 factor (ECF subfamily)
MTPAARREYETTVLPLMGMLTRKAKTLTGGRTGEAEDLVQDTLVRAYRHWHTYDASRSTARAWLSTTLRNTYRNRLEAQASRRNREQGAHADGVLNVAAVPGPDARDTGRMVRAAVAALPADYAAVVTVCDLEGATYREAAAALGCPIGTVMSRLSRARKRLAVTLAA